MEPSEKKCVRTHFHTSRKQKKSDKQFQYEPDVLSPGLAVNLATSTIFTANCIFDSR